MKKILKISALALLLLLGALIVRAFLLPSRQVRASAVSAAAVKEEKVEVDAQAAAARLVKVALAGRSAGEPSPTSDSGAPEFRLIQSTVAETFPGTLVAPNLLSGGTDSKHYLRLSRNVYRFLAVPMDAKDLLRFHGTDERMGIEGYAGAVRFFARLLLKT